MDSMQNSNIYRPITTTIVSAFLNFSKCRDIDNYIENGKLILMINTPKIIFADEKMYCAIKSYENENTKIILYDPTQSYLYQYINDVHLSEFRIHSKSPKKDTKEYMFVICNKTEWIKTAVQMNPFQTPNFLWIDFGIRHVFRTDEKLVDSIEKAVRKQYDTVRIASIWDTNIRYYVNLYKEVAWYFAGGVVGGSGECLVRFADKIRELCLATILEKKTLVWEVNIWYMLFQTHPELFDCYRCDHNETILYNY